MGQAVRELRLRGVPIWLLRRYLEQLGAREIAPPSPGGSDLDGVVRADAAMSGEGWTALWRSERHAMHPRLPTRIAEHHFTFAAESEALLDSVLERFMLKAHRGGG